MTEPSLDPGIDVVHDPSALTRTSRWQKVVAVVGLVVTLWVGTEMYDVLYGDIGGGPGPGRHSPGQESPVENQDQQDDTDDGGGHTPPGGGHG